VIAKLKRILAKDIVKVFSLNAGATLVRMLTGFVSVKIVAVLIGPAGIALLGQLNNFSSIFLTASTGGINNGVTKYIAENQCSQQKINIYLRTALWITLSLSAVCGLVLLTGSGYFARLILKDTGYQGVIIVFGITIVLYALNGLLVSILNGYKQFTKYVRVNIAGSIVSLLFSAGLAYFFGVYGALLAAVTYQSVVLVVTVILCSRCDWFKKVNFFGPFSRQAGKRLSHYSVMSLVSAATVPVSQLIVRSYMLHHTSLADAGIWEGMNRISAMYLMVITTSLSVYYLPRLSELKTRDALRKEIRSVYKLLVPVLLSATILIYVFRHAIVSILFDVNFADMQRLFAFQLIGDFLKMTSWILAFQMLAKSMTVLYVTTEITFSLSFVLLAMLFINKYGNTGATIAYAINYLGYLMLMMLVFRKMII
jgi:PST family polysaccharide transporter